MKITVDVMGSDLGFKPLVNASLTFLELFDDISIILVGKMNLLKKYLNTKKIKPTILKRLEILNANEEILMTDSILEIRRKKDNSMAKAIECVVNNKASAVCTAGASGPFIAANHLILGEIAGIKRPGFMAIMPTKIIGKQILFIDVGANIENDSYDLEMFAMMANIYVNKIWKINQPKIALLNIGIESSKGNQLQKETYNLLKNNKQLNFIGNIEPNNFMNGTVDVVVTDGFTGNIALKSVEGMARNLLGSLKNSFTKNFFRKLLALGLKKSFNEVRNTFDYKNTGGAILCGVNGISFKAHGSSDEQAFLSTLKLVRSALKENVLSVIKTSIKQQEIKEQI